MTQIDHRSTLTATPAISSPPEAGGIFGIDRRRLFLIAIAVAIIAVVASNWSTLFRLLPPTWRAFVLNSGHIHISTDAPGKLLLDGTPVTIPDDSIITCDNGERTLQFVGDDPANTQDTTVIVDHQSREAPLKVAFSRRK